MRHRPINMPKQIYMELIQCLNKHFGTILAPEKELLFCNFVKPPAVRVTKLSWFSWGFPHSGIEYPTSWETFLSQENLDD